jgi:hypothetical protein
MVSTNSWLYYTAGSVCSDISLLSTRLPCITQGAWYVLSALGLYATTPGTTEYVLGSPVFRHVRIARSAEPYEPYYERSYEQVSSAGTDAGRVGVVSWHDGAVHSMLSCQGYMPIRCILCFTANSLPCCWPLSLLF